MVVRRRAATLGFSALLALSGCHAGNSGGLNKSTAPPVTRQEVMVTRIIAQHNKNAASIRSIQARPSIHIVGGGPASKADGKLAMERPKDFRLILSSLGRKKGDIGSNADGFWFWVDDDKEKKIYACKHDEVNASPLALTLQPDWIVEAMGLREFPPEEARTINAKAVEGKPGQVVLTQFRKDAKGQQLTKETVIDEATGEIREHRLYAGAKTKLLAKAEIMSYMTKDLAEPSASSDPDQAPSPTTRIKLPSKFRLTWVEEKFAIDIFMPEAQINPQFTTASRTALFNEPTIPGVARQDLAALGTSRMYESSPRSGIGLGQPEPAPIDVEGSYSPRPSPANARPLAANLRRSTAPPPQSGSLGVVRAPIPTGTDPETERTSGSNLLMPTPRDQ